MNATGGERTEPAMQPSDARALVPPQTPAADFVAYADGACSPNPGTARLGVCIEAADGQIVCRLSKRIGRATNNIAEWHAAIAALDWLLAHAHGCVELRMDSRLVVHQLRGEWSVRDSKLQPLVAEGRRRLAALEARGVVCRVRWIPRRQNRADEVAGDPVGSSRR